MLTFPAPVPLAYPAATDNQLRSWNNIDLFGSNIGAADGYEAYPALTDTAVATDFRARAYLAVNCAQCHQPGGPAPTALDFRFDQNRNLERHRVGEYTNDNQEKEHPAPVKLHQFFKNIHAGTPYPLPMYPRSMPRMTFRAVATMPSPTPMTIAL